MKASVNKGYLYSSLEKDVDITHPEVPLSEYPRPNLQRDSYLCLNGTWDFAVTKSPELPISYSSSILVPYAPEAPLSQVSRLIQPDDFLFYRRLVQIPSEMLKEHIFLHFNGVDQICTLFINGQEVFSHTGGYTPFEADIKPFIKNGPTEITLRVQDLTDTSFYMRGKQTLSPTGWFYSSSSGIYKTVWLEACPRNYVRSVRFTPMYDEKAVSVLILTAKKEEMRVQIGSQSLKIVSNVPSIVRLKEFHPWDNIDPYLYHVEIQGKEDKVTSYFGLRKIEVFSDGPFSSLYLNNKRLVLNGLLDQGYYYRGNLTPSSYEDMKKEILKVKELGFNCLRKHVKVEDDLFYYYCDLFGLFLIQDFPNGGTRYKFLNVALPRLSIKLLNHEKFCTYSRYGRKDGKGRELFLEQGEQIVNGLYNHPSILIYTIFNEAWGQFDASKCYGHFKSLDPNRLFDAASGWLNPEESDFFSIHAYTFPLFKRKDRKHQRPYILTETGGAGYPVKGHFFYPHPFGHHVCWTYKSLNTHYSRLYKGLIRLVQNKRLSVIIYTQLSDCERECNGIFTFDRKVLKIDEDLIKSLNSQIK